MKMRRTDREINDDKMIDDIICKSKICRIGFNDNGVAYIVPMNFGYVNEDGKRVFYFHSAKVGRKVELIKSKAVVGFELDTSYELWEADIACDFSAGYQSVIGTGEISVVEDVDIKEKALTEIMATNTGKRGWSFPPQMINEVAIFKLEVISLSCKEHVR